MILAAILLNAAIYEEDNRQDQNLDGGKGRK